MGTLEQIATLSGHGDRVWCVCWHPTKLLLASCGGDRSIKLWVPKLEFDNNGAASSGKEWRCVETINDFTTRTVRSVAWSPCGKFIAAGSFDAKAYIWRVVISGGNPSAPGAVSVQPVATLDGHENEVKSVAWAPSGSMLATSSRDKSVWIWELLDEGAEVDMVAALTGHEQDVKGVAWHPRMDILASASYDSTLRLWGEGDDDWVSICTMAGVHSSTVWDLAWEPAKGSRLVTVSDDCSLHLWSARPAAPGSTTVAGAVTLAHEAGMQNVHSRTVYSVAWAEDLASSGSGAGPEEGGEVRVGHEAAAPCLLATAGADDCIHILSEQKGADGSVSLVKGVTVHSAHASDVNCVRWQSPSLSGQWAWGPTGHSKPCLVLASAGDDALVKLWAYRAE